MDAQIHSEMFECFFLLFCLGWPPPPCGKQVGVGLLTRLITIKCTSSYTPLYSYGSVLVDQTICIVQNKYMA